MTYNVFSGTLNSTHFTSRYGILAQAEYRGLSLGLSRGISVTIVSPAKMAEPIEMPLGLWTQLAQVTTHWTQLHIGATWRIRLSRSCAVTNRPYVKLL